MQTPFEGFDFSLLQDPDFREDSVREELIVPLLRALGYTASPPYRIIRSRPLEHPFVYFGTVRKGITIIPDYLMERDGQYAWILDAKAPDENIDTGKNVEQAYSYAMHRDIRVPLYALCNGHKLMVFHVSYGEPIIDVELRGIQSEWGKLLTLLGSRAAWPAGIPPGFRPDLGLALVKSGLAFDQNGEKVFQMFLSLEVNYIAKVKDDLYTIVALAPNSPFIVSFDFDSAVYAQMLEKIGPESAGRIRTALSQQPFSLPLPEGEEIDIGVVGEIGDQTYTNENESYRPFIAKDFIWADDLPTLIKAIEPER